MLRATIGGRGCPAPPFRNASSLEQLDGAGPWRLTIAGGPSRTSLRQRWIDAGWQTELSARRKFRFLFFQLGANRISDTLYVCTHLLHVGSDRGDVLLNNDSDCRRIDLNIREAVTEHETPRETDACASQHNRHDRPSHPFQPSLL
jgi:hypothetical protein